MVELRKRPAREALAYPLPPKKKASSSKAKVDIAPAKPTLEPEAGSSAAAPSGEIPLLATTTSRAATIPTDTPPPPQAPANPRGGLPAVGSKIALEGFGGDVETQDGEVTNLARLVAASGAGVVLFTYPRASTPGCTTQACMFRDAYAPLTEGGLAIYGLSNDGPKANSTFQRRQNLNYPLLCDPKQTLITAIGLKKSPSGTTRGVFVVDKEGMVLAAEAGGPGATVAVVRDVVERLSKENNTKSSDKATAEVAAEVADTAAMVDKK